MATPSANSDKLVPKKPKPGILAKLGCGAIAGIVGTSVVFPLDTIKTRLQNQRSGAGIEKQYMNGLDAFKKIIKAEGPAGLYRGLIPNLIGVTPEKAIKLAVNDYCRDRIGEHIGVDADNLPVIWGMLAGATAGFCQVIATNPMEITKITMQVETLHLKPGETPRATMQVVKDLGIRGLYRGTTATLMRDVPFSFIFFPSFAVCKEYLISSMDHPTHSQKTQMSLVAGLVSGATAAALVTPMDVVKTRLQAKGGRETYKGVFDCWRQIYTKEGVSAFFKGATQRAFIVAPLFGISMLSYELFQDKFTEWTSGWSSQ